MMPYFVSLNKTNYSRYGAYYVKQLKNLDQLHPGCKEIIQSKWLSVQAQDKYPWCIPIDQRGKQTLNKDAKSTEGTKSFANTNDAVTKWTLNRASQAKVTATLKKFSGHYIFIISQL